MKTIFIDPFTVSSIPIIGICNGIAISSATTFIWHHDNHFFLVSNWHVFSGREPRTGQPKNKNGAVPDHFMILAHRHDQIGNIVEGRTPAFDSEGRPRWWQHPIHGQDIDIAVIPLFDQSFYNTMPNSSKLLVTPVNKMPLVTNAEVGIGEDLFIIGFPLGISQQKNIPIWKRASVASELAIDFNDFPCFLVDTATREGMSGSPVFWRSHHGGYRSNEALLALGTGPQGALPTKFLGVYSGRYVGDNLGDAQLGIVWKAHLVDEIIQARSPGDFRLR